MPSACPTGCPTRSASLGRVTVVTVALAAAAGLTLAGCGSVDDGTAPVPTAEVSIPEEAGIVEDGVHNAQDAAFATDMIIHHRQAILMARLAADRTRNEKVLSLARRIETEQVPEVQQLARWLAEWGRPVPAASVTEPAGHTLAGMATPADLAALRAATDEAFDRAFLTLMVSHHEGAATQALDQLRTGADERAKGLARDIVTSRTATVAEMRALLA